MQHSSWPVDCLKEEKSFRTISENECLSQIFLSVAFLLMVYWILNMLIFGVRQITEARATPLSISSQLFLWIFFFKMINLEKSPYVLNKHGQRHTSKRLSGQLIGIERPSQVFLSVAFLLMVYWIPIMLIFGKTQIIEARATRLSISLQLSLWMFFSKCFRRLN